MKALITLSALLVATFSFSQETTYKIQIGAFSKANVEFNDLTNVSMYTTRTGIHKYLSGSFSNYADARLHKDSLIQIGYEGAFLVGFQNNEIVPPSVWIKKVESNDIEKYHASVNSSTNQAPKSEHKDQDNNESSNDEVIITDITVNNVANNDDSEKNDNTISDEIIIQEDNNDVVVNDTETTFNIDSRVIDTTVPNQSLEVNTIILPDEEEEIFEEGDSYLVYNTVDSTEAKSPTIEAAKYKGERTKPVEKIKNDQIYYKIQIADLEGQLSNETMARFNEIDELVYYFVSPTGSNVYTIGDFENSDQAENKIKKLQSQGFEDLVVVAIKDGKIFVPSNETVSN